MRSRRPRTGAIVRNALIVVASVAVLFPIVWMVSFSLRTNLEVGTPGIIPPNPTLENYVRMWSVAPFVEFFRNSVVVTVGAVAVTLVLGAPAGYALARFRVRGRPLITGGLVFSQVYCLSRCWWSRCSSLLAKSGSTTPRSGS